MRFVRCLAVLLVVLGVLCAASSAWYLIDSSSCAQYERLCVGVQFGTIFTALALYMSVVGIVMGVRLMRKSQTDSEETPGAGYLIGSAIMTPIGICCGLYAIIGLISYDPHMLMPNPTLFNLSDMVGHSIAYMAVGIGLLVWGVKERKKKC